MLLCSLSHVEKKEDRSVSSSEEQQADIDLQPLLWDSCTTRGKLESTRHDSICFESELQYPYREFI